MNNYYNLFGLDESCTDEQLENAYKALKSKYSEERFLEGEAGNLAAKKLTEIENAYRDIVVERREKSSFSNDGNSAYQQIEQLLKDGKLQEAQYELDKFNERNAEWHYLQAVIFYKKNWNNESKKQLEIAIQMDADNQKYKNSYAKLNERIKTESNKSFTSYTSGDGNKYEQYEEPRQMGGDGCCQWCCEMAICNMMLNCCCNSCG
jgi:DnaJ-class molecular chaperone